jgi:L-ascorbate metabolism protein UlaG (beta-lactamase superfamily)
MKLTYYGHSCFLLELNGKSILFDPFISGNELAAAIDPASLRCDYIFLSHAHGDHVADVDTVVANNPAVQIVGMAEVSGYYGKKGYKAHPMNIGGWWNFDFGRVKLVSATHSSTFPDGSTGGNPAGFVIDSTEGVVYFAGDTGLTMDMQLIPMICPPLDLAILPIGSNFTMDYHEALIASDFIRCNRIVGCHFDTFGFIKIDHAAAIAAFEAKGKDLELLPVGGSLEN